MGCCLVGGNSLKGTDGPFVLRAATCAHVKRSAEPLICLYQYRYINGYGQNTGEIHALVADSAGLNRCAHAKNET